MFCFQTQDLIVGLFRLLLALGLLLIVLLWLSDAFLDLTLDSGHFVLWASKLLSVCVNLFLQKFVLWLRFIKSQLFIALVFLNVQQLDLVLFLLNWSWSSFSLFLLFLNFNVKLFHLVFKNHEAAKSKIEVTVFLIRASLWRGQFLFRVKLFRVRTYLKVVLCCRRSQWNSFWVRIYLI